MANGREKLGLVWSWRKAAVIAIAIIVAVAIGNLIPSTEGQQRDKLGLPLPGAPVEPANVADMVLPLPDKPSIAVMPFLNITGKADDEFLSNGFSEDIW